MQKFSVEFTRGSLLIDVPQSSVEPFIQELKNHVGDDEYSRLRNSAIQRYVNSYVRSHKKDVVESFTDADLNEFFENFRNSFHITLVLPHQVRRLVADKVNTWNLFEGEYNVDFIGMGSVSEISETGELNRVFYIVVESEELGLVFDSIGYDRPDFHVTLGFDSSDIFDQAKDRSTIIS